VRVTPPRPSTRTLLLGVLFVMSACNQAGVSDGPISGSSGFARAPIPTDPKASPPPSLDVTPDCPGFEAPTEGAACSRLSTSSSDGLCEYGHDLDRACNDIFKCVGTWRRLPPRDTCFGRCPDTLDGIVPGSRCTDTTVGCSYLDATCACVPDHDAGPSSGSDGVWRCVAPPGNGCPAQRPSSGSDCVRPMNCDYGACALQRDVVYSCVGERWIQTSFPESCN
jgi:hypothetical protein